MVTKNQHLLIFGDFGKIFDFLPDFGDLKSWGNRQTQKKIVFFQQVEKCMTVHNDSYILKNASKYQMDAIFAIKIFWLFGYQKPEDFYPRFIGPL